MESNFAKFTVLKWLQKFESHSTGVGHDLNSSEQQEINAWTNQQE